MQLKFNTPGIYSQIYLADASLAVLFEYTSKEEPEHIAQGFCVRPNSVAISTTTDEEYLVTVCDEPILPEILNKAIFAVRLPCQFESEVVFIDGTMGYLEQDVFMQAKEVTSVEDFQNLADRDIAYLFPVSGVTGVTFIELPNLQLFIYFEKDVDVETELIVPHERFQRQSNFLLTAKAAIL